MENYSVSKISSGNCLRMKHQTLERTKNYRSQHRRIPEKSLASPFFWEETLLRSGSDKFTSAVFQTPGLVFHGVLHKFCISCSVDGRGGAATSPPQGSAPWWCLLQPHGFAAEIQLTETQLCADICTRHTPGDVYPHTTTPASQQTSQTTPAFNTSPEFHKMLPVALEFLINSTDI